MRYSKWQVATVLGFLIGTLATDRSQVCGQERSSPDASQEAIASLIGQLGDRSYDRRTAATRQLCIVGLPAVDQLREAAGKADTETALRSRSILSTIDQIPFRGVEVQLSLSKSTIAWDEPVDLLIVLVNRSPHPAKVPFDLDPNRRAMFSTDARHVGDMLDVSDCVHVTRHDGETIDLVVDEISVDPAVAEVVQSRIDGGPLTDLQAGETVSLTVHAFNRGWARFPLLETGLYTITVDYIPPWKDEVLQDQRVGQVTSKPVTLRVTDGAPPTVLRNGPEASLELRREGDILIAEVTNHSDQDLVVNRNYGVAAPFAQGVWACQLNGDRHDLGVQGRVGTSWNDFSGSELTVVPPGRSVELARTSVAELQRRLGEAAAARPVGVHFQYTNLCNRPWQVRQGKALLANPQAPTVLRTPLPRLMLSARHTSAPVTLPAAE